MPKGELSCRCGSSKMVLQIFVGKQRIGYICENCARHSPSLRSFLNAASWFYDWRHFTFAYSNAAVRDFGFRQYLDRVMYQEGDKARFRREDAVADRIARAGGAPSLSAER